jgi:hypothetical protein
LAIKFRAIHTTRPWRKAQHSSLQKATDGPDGAKNLLRRIGRVGRKWQEYGPVSCIFVWDEDHNPGYALRLRPGSSYEIEMVTVPLHLLERYEREKGCSPSEIEAHFSSPMRLQSSAELEAPADVEEPGRVGMYSCPPLRLWWAGNTDPPYLLPCSLQVQRKI